MNTQNSFAEITNNEANIECKKHKAKFTGKKYGIVGASINVREKPSIKSNKVFNQKATKLLKKNIFVTLNNSVEVTEFCIKNNWSYVFVTTPQRLTNSHRGWVASKFLDKGQDLGEDTYIRKISSYALAPYDQKNYPKTIKKYKLRLKEIEKLRRKAAEISIDSGKCDFVEIVELSDSRSTLKHLHFWIDCRNGKRIRLDEFEIKSNSNILTEKEKSWDKNSAKQACKKAIKERSLMPSELDIHTILGTSFYKAPITHNVVISMNFDAKNAFGMEIPYTAKCYFQPGRVGEIEIYKRK